MFVTFKTPRQAETIDYPLLGEFVNFSDYVASPSGEAIAVDGQKVVLLNDETSFNPFGFFKNRNFTAGTYIVMDGRLQSVDLFHKENLIVEGFDTDLVNKALVPNYRYTFMAENPLNLTATGKTITDQAGALVAQPFVPEINERYFLRLLESGDYVLELETDAVTGPEMGEEVFEAFAGGETSVTLTQSIPSNAVVTVERQGVEIYEGLANDYTITGQVLTPAAPFVAGDKLVVRWIVSFNKAYEQVWSVADGDIAIGDTSFLVTIPITGDTVNQIWKRQGVSIYEGAANDYTQAGNAFTPLPPVVAGDKFSLISYT